MQQASLKRHLLIRIISLKPAKKGTHMGNIINTDDGEKRREWAGLIKWMVEAKLLDKFRHGKGGDTWYSYNVSELGKLWLGNWTGFLYSTEEYLELVEKKKLPRFDKHAVTYHPSTRLVEAGNWAVHVLDPLTPEFIRVVIGFTNRGDQALTVLAYSYPHDQLMADPIEWLIPLDYMNAPNNALPGFTLPVPFGSVEEMQAYLPEATRFRSYQPRVTK